MVNLSGASGITRFFHLADHTHLASLAVKAQDGVSAGVDQRQRSGLDVTAYRIAIRYGEETCTRSASPGLQS